MKAVDTNILVYAHRKEMPRHEEAYKLVTALVRGQEPWAIPIFCISEFIRVTTHPSIMPKPSPLASAIEFVNALRTSRMLRILQPGEDYVSLFLDVCNESAATANLAFDASIVAVCLEHGVRHIVTEDRDFRRFSGINVVSLLK